MTDEITLIRTEYAAMRRQLTATLDQVEELKQRVHQLEGQLGQDSYRSNQTSSGDKRRLSTMVTIKYSLNQMAIILGVDYKIIYNCVRKQEIGSFRIGGQYTIPEVELQAYLAKMSMDLTQGRYWTLVPVPNEELPRAVIVDASHDFESVPTEAEGELR